MQSVDSAVPTRDLLDKVELGESERRKASNVCLKRSKFEVFYPPGCVKECGGWTMRSMEGALASAQLVSQPIRRRTGLSTASKLWWSIELSMQREGTIKVRIP